MSSHDRLCQLKASTSPKETHDFVKGVKSKQMGDGNRQGKEGIGGFRSKKEHTKKDNKNGTRMS
jgi:hypothetical protein